MLYQRLKMCKACPFRAKAPPGWLGPWSPVQLAAAVSADQALACHTHLDTLTETHGIPLEVVKSEGLAQQCVGALRYANACHKLSRDRVRSCVQGILDSVKDQPVIAAGQFIEHHTQRVKS